MRLLGGKHHELHELEIWSFGTYCAGGKAYVYVVLKDFSQWERPLFGVEWRAVSGEGSAF